MQQNHKIKGRRLDVKKALSKNVMGSNNNSRRGRGWGNRQGGDWGDSGKSFTQGILLSTLLCIGFSMKLLTILFLSGHGPGGGWNNQNPWENSEGNWDNQGYGDQGWGQNFGSGYQQNYGGGPMRQNYSNLRQQPYNPGTIY